MTYQEPNRLKSDRKKPADKLRKSSLARAKKKSLTQGAEAEARNRDADGKSHRNVLLRRSELTVGRLCSDLVRAEQSATGGVQSGEPQLPGKAPSSSRRRKIKRTKRLSGRSLVWLLF